MGADYLIQSRHGTVFHFRRRVPDDLRSIVRKPYLVKSLCTTQRREAIIAARTLAARTDELFHHLRTMARDHEPIRIDFGFKLDLDDLGKVSSITVTDAKPEDAEALTSVITAAMRSDTSAKPAIRPEPKPIGLPFAEAIEQYLHMGHCKATTRKTYRSRLAHGQKYFSDSDIRHIEQSHLSAFARHALESIPNEATAKLCISTVVGMLNHYRITEGWGPELTTKKLLPKKQTPDTHDRDGYTIPQLAVLFNSSQEYRERAPAKYWVTIATAFTGCRIEELAGIELPHDLKHDAQADVWYLDLNGRADADGVNRKSLKNTSSWRCIPLHSSLVRHGFVAYLQAQHANGHIRPFQSQWDAYIERGEGDNAYKWSHYIVAWGGRELTRLAKSGAIQRGQLSYFHSLRHSFSQLLDAARISAEVSEAALGHTISRGDRDRYNKMKTKPGLLSREGIEPGLSALAALLELK